MMTATKPADEYISRYVTHGLRNVPSRKALTSFPTRACKL